jgi:hypothetical protein
MSKNEVFSNLLEQKKFGKCLLVFKLAVQEIIAEVMQEEEDYWVIKNVVEIQAIPDPNRQGQFAIAGSPWSVLITRDQECALYKGSVTGVFVLENEKMLQDYIRNFSGIDIPTAVPPGGSPRQGTVLDLKGRPVSS